MNIGLIIGIIVIGIIVLSVIGFIVGRLKVVDISEALVVSGSRSKGEVKVVPPGGRAFVLPLVQRAVWIPLSQQTLNLIVDGVDSNSIPIQISATANIKVGSSPEDIRAAGERFSAYKDMVGAIKDNVTNVLLGSLRAVISSMTAQSLLMDRSELVTKVQEIAAQELRNMGIAIDSLTINEITDSNDYIKSLAVPETESVLKRARIAKATANREANDVEVDAKIKIAERQKELDIRAAQLKGETDISQEESNASGPLAKAEQEEYIATVEAKAAEKQALLRDRQLDIEVRRPADAELYRIQKDAEAEKAILVANAQAEAMEKRAEAYKMYNEAAVLQLVIDKLPEVAREIASPMSNIDDLTVVSTEGATSLTRNVAGGFSELKAVVESFTGMSLDSLLAGKATTESEPKKPSAQPPPPEVVQADPVSSEERA
ncbi:hypothetical protein FYJ24_00365 [Actinomycetaceae bacterium WB03_NA08]|uniref:Flotillin n=1 Tax=Scrofimicrobium canadense TaxID=2652290 RepID=A0A6N7W409_9ACTO|nr:flotillin family protein [Scrofimicrobium canadense]MSS83243.1 hypothetical protein [Scrofimicrobium canadense]